jgi:hypothetical protein
MAALATLADLAALGALPVDVGEDSSEAVRATRLLELVSGAVLTLLDGFAVTEAAVLEWDEFRRDALAAVVAEIAAKRLNVSAASSVDPYGTTEGPQTLKLNRWEKRALLELLPVVEATDDTDASGAANWYMP